MNNSLDGNNLLPPCPICSNAFIELFGAKSSWLVGCKPCSRRGRDDSHFHTKSRTSAVLAWQDWVDKHAQRES